MELATFKIYLEMIKLHLETAKVIGYERPHLIDGCLGKVHRGLQKNTAQLLTLFMLSKL